MLKGCFVLTIVSELGKLPGPKDFFKENRVGSQRFEQDSEKALLDCLNDEDLCKACVSWSQEF